MTRIDHRQIVALHARYSAALVLYARQWCDNPDDAAQEAMIELSQRSPPPHDPVGWLFTATRRRAINQARSQRRWDAHQRRAAAERPQEGLDADDNGLAAVAAADGSARLVPVDLPPRTWRHVFQMNDGQIVRW